MSRMRPRRFASLCILASARQQASLRKTYGYSRPFFISPGVVTISSRAAHGGGEGEKEGEEKRGKKGWKGTACSPQNRREMVYVGYSKVRIVEGSFSGDLVLLRRFYVSWNCNNILSIFKLAIARKLRVDNFYDYACFCIRNIGKFFVVFPFVARYRRIKLKLG